VLVTGVQGTGKSTVANSVAEVLGAAVLAHDWAMSGLRPFPEIQAALDAMDPPGHRVVGWSILKALAQEQLHRGSSVVLDGVARAPQIALCRRMAQELSAKLVVIMTKCSDLEVHRSRIEGRKRAIPNWPELGWSHVQGTLTEWETPDGIDLVLEATDRWEDNVTRLHDFFGGT
jgi:predicted kinase